MTVINNVINNIIGFIVLIIFTALFFKSGRKLLNDLMKKLLEVIKKSSINLLKYSILKIWNLIKKISSELKTIKAIWLNYKERYMYLACTTTSLVLLVYKYGINYILFLAPFVYFILKAMTKEIREEIVKSKQDKISNKYKGISEMFNDRVKVIEVKDDIYKLHSFIPLQDIEKKQNNIEHFLNREIVEIKRNSHNFKLIEIITNSNKSKTESNINKNYLFEDYLINIKKDSKKEIMFITGIDKKGNILVFDLIKLTHTFIAGMQGGGKSNLINVIIQSMMYLNENVFYIMVDFKLVELCQYENFKNTVFIEKLEDFWKELIKLEIEMDSRYMKIKDLQVKNIGQYNKKSSKKMSYIVLIIDEMGDIGLCNNQKLKDGIEDILTRVMNKGRAAGVLVIGSTQRPSATQINTNIRDRFGTKFSARIKDKKTQEMAGIKGTENLKNGQFKMEFIEDITTFKAFFIDELKNNKVYENLSKNLIGGVNLDKYI